MEGTTTTDDAERAVLAAMLASSEAVWDVLEAVQPDDFADVRHEVVARTIVALANTGRPHDVVAVASALERQGDLRRAGGEAFLWGLDPVSAQPGSAAYYAELVRDQAMLRRLRDAGQSVFALASGAGDVAELAEQARATVDAAVLRTGGRVRPVGDALAAALDGLERSSVEFVPTPWDALNGYLTGFHPGRLYVIGARPGSGKTIMALQAAVALAATGRVAFSSLEMEEGDLMRRLLAQTASVDLSAMERGTLQPADWERIAQARPRIASMPLFVDDRPHVFPAQIRAHARNVSRGGKLAAVVVDYVGLVATPDDRRGRWEHVGAISRAMKVMARELRVPVIALAQLNRESEGRGGLRRLPTMADLRESGSIEQDADVVLLLQRQHDDEGRERDQLDVVVGKNRHGRTGKVTLRWEGQHARVISDAWTPPRLPSAVPLTRMDLE